MTTEEIEGTRLIAVYDKQLGYYVKSIPLKIDLNYLIQLYQQYVDDPLSYSYKITPEMSNLLKKYITMEFDYNRFDYTMEQTGKRYIYVFNKRNDNYITRIPIKIDFDILNKLFKQYEDDPLFYCAYGVTRKLANILKTYVEPGFDFDFKHFSYLVETRSVD